MRQFRDTLTEFDITTPNGLDALTTRLEDLSRRWKEFREDFYRELNEVMDRDMSGIRQEGGNMSNFVERLERLEQARDVLGDDVVKKNALLAQARKHAYDTYCEVVTLTLEREVGEMWELQKKANEIGLELESPVSMRKRQYGEFSISFGEYELYSNGNITFSNIHLSVPSGMDEERFEEFCRDWGLVTTEDINSLKRRIAMLPESWQKVQSAFYESLDGALDKVLSGEKEQKASAQKMYEDEEDMER
jgi:uncharacterized protein (UPF0335 family)